MWPNPQFPQEILNGKLHFLCSVTFQKISWLRLLELLVWEAYNKIKIWFFALKLRWFGSTFSRFPKSFSLWQGKRNCSVVSTLVPHLQIGLIVSLKPCLNLCSLRRLNGSLKRVMSFKPIGS